MPVKSAKPSSERVDLSKTIREVGYASQRVGEVLAQAQQRAIAISRAMPVVERVWTEGSKSGFVVDSTRLDAHGKLLLVQAEVAKLSLEVIEALAQMHNAESGRAEVAHHTQNRDAKVVHSA